MPRSTRRKTQKIRVQKLQPPKVKKGKSLSKRKVKVSRKKNKKGGMPPRRSTRGKKTVEEAAVEEPPDEETGGARGDETKQVKDLPDEEAGEARGDETERVEEPPHSPVEEAGGGARRDEPKRVPVSATGEGYYQQMKAEEFDNLSTQEQELLLEERRLKEGQREQERARAYFAAQPESGPTQQEEAFAEFNRGQQALGPEVRRLSYALHQSQEVAKQMMKERDAMATRMSKMEQECLAYVAQLQEQIQFLSEQLDRLHNPNRGGPPPGNPYGI